MTVDICNYVQGQLVPKDKKSHKHPAFVEGRPSQYWNMTSGPDGLPSAVHQSPAYAYNLQYTML